MTDTSFNVAELKDKLLARRKYPDMVGTFCLHQSSGYLTPQEWPECDLQSKRKEEVSLTIWTRILA